ncbi:MAG: CHAT domain-containing protein [Heteroscytonema crispum UTEX LB 1556]
MSKLIVINLGDGDLYNGFPRVTVQVWTEGNLYTEEFIGSLPPAPYLAELYRNWQSIYQALCDRKELRSLSQLQEVQKVEDDDELEIDASGITNVSVVSFNEVCKNLEYSINNWLKSADFFDIEKLLRSRLNRAEEVRVILELNDVLLRRLPWHCWDLFRDYPQAEMALSRPEYQRLEPCLIKSYSAPQLNMSALSIQPKPQKKFVKILAILGNSQGIDLEIESKFLKNLQDAEVDFLTKPSYQELNTKLSHQNGWNILFFAGHSQTEGETGRIYINENQTNNSLTIEQLEEALKAAIKNGLRLAIFNSCDGLGLALAMEKFYIPVVIVMREPVPNFVAQEFFQHFLSAFAIDGLPLYMAVQQARRKLQSLEDDFPGASWLPVICINSRLEGHQSLMVSN